MNKRGLLLGALLCLVAGVLAFLTAGAVGRRQSERLEVRRLHAVADPPPPSETASWLTEYTLTERSGRSFSSQELEGSVHVVSFFFASCPTVCRLQNGRIQDLARDFGPEGVVFLSITCDPENDTPAALQNYARQFDADREQWLFLTSSDLNYLRRVGAEVYGLAVDKQVHSERLIVVDRWGTIRGHYHWNEPSEVAAMRTALHKLLAETEPPPSADARFSASADIEHASSTGAGFAPDDGLAPREVADDRDAG